MNNEQRKAIENRIANINELVKEANGANVVTFNSYTDTFRLTLEQNPVILEKCKEIAMIQYAQELEELREGLGDV
jgi:hypothetical protein